MISESMFPVPYDSLELKKICKLLAKIPEFRERLQELEEDIDELAKKAKSLSPYSNSLGIEVMHLIYRAFYSDLENRPFQAPTEEQLRRLAGDWHLGVIRRRNIPCEICGENRAVDLCHILPKYMGGPASNDNLLILCPTHHRLFDRYMLSRSEYAQIDWSTKSKPAQDYEETVILKAHQSFWNQIDEGLYESLGYYHEDASTFPFVKVATKQILSIFKDSRPIKRNNVYRLITPEFVHIAKKAIPVLVKRGCIKQEKVGTVNYLSINNQCSAVDERTFRKIWSYFS